MGAKLTIHTLLLDRPVADSQVLKRLLSALPSVVTWDRVMRLNTATNREDWFAPEQLDDPGFISVQEPGSFLFLYGTIRWQEQSVPLALCRESIGGGTAYTLSLPVEIIETSREETPHPIDSRLRTWRDVSVALYRHFDDCHDRLVFAGIETETSALSENGLALLPGILSDSRVLWVVTGPNLTPAVAADISQHGFLREQQTDDLMVLLRGDYLLRLA